MSLFKGAFCTRCGMPLEGNYYDPCPHCLEEGFYVNYTTKYDLANATLPKANKHNDSGIYRFKDFFALKDNSKQISIGEGNTPLYKLERLGRKLGLENLYMKDESKNPTMSHKDRMCSLIISKALEDNSIGVTISSTGNQGAATAAYCAASNIPCIIFTTPNVSTTMKTLMQAYGAYVFVTPTMQDRTIIMEKLVRELGFAPASGLITPPIGSSCYGIDGYKTISYEVYEQLDNSVPDWFVVPISYGDTLYGIYKGMLDLKQMNYINNIPKFVAAEVFNAAEYTLKMKSENPILQPSKQSIQTSIATGYVAYHTVQAIKNSNGYARSSHDNEALDMQKLLAQTEGIFAEASSVSSLVVLKKLIIEGKIKSDDKIVVLITSTGIKDPDTASLWLPQIPCIKPEINELKVALKNSYGFNL